ncbi:MAG: hypothetical protein KKF50_04590 [Nanoarchaeota archaeon]|nr:hypothetical protein [Nanoarchaeota archaeon]
MSLNKRANLVTDNTVELIIAAAGIVVLIFLLIALYSPTYDENAETAKSYLQMFNEQVSSADSLVEGSLTFWGPETENVKFYLAYFGDLSRFDKEIEKEKVIFVTRKRNENAICVCYGNAEKMNCKNCKELDLPVELKVSGYDKFPPWVLDEVKQLKITKVGGKYLFSM